MALLTDKPRYVHDCEACKFLGYHNEYDLYCCKNNFVTVIARYSSHGPDYKSSIFDIVFDPDLTEAANRAIKLGLVK